MSARVDHFYGEVQIVGNIMQFVPIIHGCIKSIEASWYNSRLNIVTLLAFMSITNNLN